MSSNLSGDDCAFGCYNITEDKFTSKIKANGTAIFSSNNIQLYPGGSANYVGGINIGVADGDSDGNDATIQLRSDGAQTNTNSIGIARTGGDSGDTSFIGTWNAATTFYVTAKGDGWFNGNVTAGNVSFNLDPDNPDSWQTKEESYEEQITGPLGQVERTVTRTREVKEYVGATLSVKDELIALRDRATKQDEVIAQMTRMLADLGADVSTLPANDSPAPKKKGGKR